MSEGPILSTILTFVTEIYQTKEDKRKSMEKYIRNKNNNNN